MEFQFVIGVDVSKEWFDVCVINKKLEKLYEVQVDNQTAAIEEFIHQLLQQLDLSELSPLVLVMEHTGIYVQPLTRSWMANGGRLSIVPAQKVSHLLGGPHGWVEKTDQLDAQRLAEYGLRYSDQLQLWQAKPQVLLLLQGFQRQRQRLIDAINLLEVPVRESKGYDDEWLSEALAANQQESVKGLKKDLKQLEKRIQQLIDQDDELRQLFALISSVEGIGPVTAREVIIATSGFTEFRPDQAKSFSRYAGVVPLRRQSGKKSRRPRSSKRANKRIKALLTMGATSLIRGASELGQYYRRKKAEGKAHLSIINAMRNKLILRIFAVVRNQRMYQKNLNQQLELA